MLYSYGCKIVSYNIILKFPNPLRHCRRDSTDPRTGSDIDLDWPEGVSSEERALKRKILEKQEGVQASLLGDGTVAMRYGASLRGQPFSKVRGTIRLRIEKAVLCK